MTTFECLTNPEKHGKLCEYGGRRFEIDVLLPLLDLTMEAEILGAKVLFIGKEAPQIMKHVDLEGLGKEKDPGRMQFFPKTVGKMKTVSGTLPVGAYVTGPFTIAGQTIGLTNLLKFMRTRREEILVLLKDALEIVLEYAMSLEENGADFM